MFDKFKEITPGKLAKAALIGGGVCVAAVAAPIGIVAVVGITAAGAATSWAVDSLSDEINNKNKDNRSD